MNKETNKQDEIVNVWDMDTDSNGSLANDNDIQEEKTDSKTQQVVVKNADLEVNNVPRKRRQIRKNDITYQLKKGYKKTAIPFTRMSKLIRSTTEDVIGHQTRWSHKAISILHIAAEQELTNIFKDGRFVMERANKKTLIPRDMQAVISIQKKDCFRKLFSKYERNVNQKNELKRNGVDHKKIANTLYKI